jgi:hypothetical protein
MEYQVSSNHILAVKREDEEQMLQCTELWLMSTRIQMKLTNFLT